MDSSFYLASGGITIVFGLLLGLVAFSFFRRFKKVNSLLNRAHEMTGTANGRISEVVSVRRRNRSFRWTNEYPVITYTVDSKDYTTQLDFAEKRKGHYDLGGNYRVCYIPSDPSCCIVDEFRKPMQSNRTQAIVFTVIFAIITFNFVISGLYCLNKVISKCGKISQILSSGISFGIFSNFSFHYPAFRHSNPYNCPADLPSR